MTDKIALLMIVIAMLTVKHVIFDFFLQTLASIKNKRIYGHPDGLIHAGGHAAGTCLAFFVITPPLGMAVGIVVAEIILHYHLDWVKEVIGYRWKLQPDQRLFWWAFGIDQGLHHLTYVGITAVLAYA